MKNSPSRLILTHHAIVDRVWKLPMTVSEYVTKLLSGEPRFVGECNERIGGGGINSALVAASLGKKVVFAGFADKAAMALIEKIKKECGLNFPLHAIDCGERKNTIFELSNGNHLLKNIAPDHDSKSIVGRISSLSVSDNDWVVSASFYPHITLPLLDISTNFFLDTGYDATRRAQNLLSLLCDRLNSAPPRNFQFIIGANEREIVNIAEEFGMSVFDGQHLAERISERAGTKIQILLHTSEFSTLFDPDVHDSWVVPCFELQAIKRLTNAGDTLNGAFLSALSSGFEHIPALFFAQAAVAKRLCDDELPTPQNTAEFLKTVRMKRPSLPPEIRIVGMSEISDSLNQKSNRITLTRALSVCDRPSPASRRPAA